METTDKTVAVEILKQLGGGKFLAMTGAKNLTCTDYSMGFQISSRMTKDSISHVKIILNSMDTYDIEYIAIRGTKIKHIDKFKGAYCDMLADVVSSRLGLCFSL